MEIELMYDGLFSLINGIVSLVNMFLLGFTINRYKTRKVVKILQQQEAIENPENNVPEEKLTVSLAGSSKEDSKRADILISKVTEDRLIEEFEKVKEEQFFLKKGISIKDLAKMLGTNQRYVSYILNKHTGMDFNNFVQQSRVDYLIESIEEDPEMLNVKFSVLADKAGFSSMSKFSTVFKSVKGVPPSEYFHRLRTAS
ncbi:helix-turn-helix domain-containing protein [Sphingobacterium kitahiroshimense]|uniref:Helix-turn-helix domain-containing protein n=1 Tax=Sphingobacterium kitahiroshimense TaxID=470446 RepID=A0ABV0BXG4_9SPHI